MIHAKDFISACTARGYSFFSGVPCSFLKPLLDGVIQAPNTQYVAATSEGEAVAIGAGVHLAGGKSVVMAQNSGLGNMVNPLTSLNFPFRITGLLIISQRGQPGLGDEPEHELMGQITCEMLDTLRIPWAFFPGEPKAINPALNEAEARMRAAGVPFAFVMRKGEVEKWDSPLTPENKPDMQPAIPEGRFASRPDERLSRALAIKIISQMAPDKTALIATTGKAGRELFELADRDNHFYVVGSMGCASAIGFGIQVKRPDQEVIILDGDGAAMMKMGTIATIGHYKPSRLIHIILDNEAYESTGGQSSVSSTVDFSQIAAACGYRQCIRVDNEKELIVVMKRFPELSCPTLIHLKVACESDPNLGRPTLRPFEVKERFMRFLKFNGATTASADAKQK